jgi:hypothetical protein
MTTPTYKSGSTVPVTVPLPFVDGASLIPTAVTVAVHDEAGVVLDTISPALPTVGAEEIAFDIPANLNLLEPDARKGARQVEVEFTTSRGTFIETAHYLIESKTQLTPLVNTFQTYPEALMTRSDLAQASGWDAATDSMRIAALHLAHTAMCNMRYRYRVGINNQRRVRGFPGTRFDSDGVAYTTVTDIRNTLPWEWAEFPQEFKDALKRAQIAEANAQLQGDPIGDKRRAGIVSETIGEASMFLKQVPEVQLPVSREALEHLRGFITYSVGIARA